MTQNAGVAHQIGLFDTADGLSLYEQTWLPRRTKGVVVIVHGIAEYSGRYDGVAEALAAAEYVTETYDQRGHGRSEGPRALVTSFEQLAADLDLFMARVKARHAGQPIFLMGHSLGGGLAAYYAITRQPDINGLALSAPSVATGDVGAKALVSVVRVLARLFPGMPFIKLDSKMISRDLDESRLYDTDPLIDRKPLRLASLMALIEGGEAVQAGVDRLTLPLLMMQAEDDAVVPPQGPLDVFERAAAKDKTMHIYPEMRHEILRDPERHLVYADLVAFLDAHR